MKIGIFGGRFDPFHDGHLTMVRRGITLHGLDKIHIVPSASPPHKPVLAPFEARCKMVELSLESSLIPSDKVIIDRREGRQKDPATPSWTFTTVLDFRNEYPSPHELWLLMGDDTVMQLHTWYRIDQLIQMVHLLVYNRNKIPPNTITRYLKSHHATFLGHVIHDTGLEIPVSSSVLRNDFTLPLVAPSVAHYVKEQGLYQHKLTPVLGITGRVGSGKSTATHYLSTHFDVTLLDLDIIGHQLLLRKEIKNEIRDAFGESVFLGNEINRKALGHIVFSNTDALQTLNHIVHPQIRDVVVNKITNATTSAVIIAGALLDEIGLLPLCNNIWVIDSSDSHIEAAIGRKFDIRHSQKPRERYQTQGTVVTNTFDDTFFGTLDHMFRDFISIKR